MSKRKLKEKFGFKIHSVKQKLFLKEKELEATLKAFDEIRDELSYYKGFHDGVKNGAKVNFSPTINQPQKKEFPSGGVTEAKPHNEDREFCKMRPRPENHQKSFKLFKRL